MLKFLIPACSWHGYYPSHLHFLRLVSWVIFIPPFLKLFFDSFDAAPGWIVDLSSAWQGKIFAFIPAIDLVLALALFLVLTAFALNMFGMANQFPRLFDAGYFILKNGQLMPFIVGSVLAVPCLAWGRKFVKQG